MEVLARAEPVPVHLAVGRAHEGRKPGVPRPRHRVLELGRYRRRRTPGGSCGNAIIKRARIAANCHDRNQLLIEFSRGAWNYSGFCATISVLLFLSAKISRALGR